MDYLSRARSAAKTKEILRDLADGKINIIVGTHKLIGKSVKFKDLGLLIIDEEQKFGVANQRKAAADEGQRGHADAYRHADSAYVAVLPDGGTRFVGHTDPAAQPLSRADRGAYVQCGADSRGGQLRDEPQRAGVHREQPYFQSLRFGALLHKHVPDARVCVGHGQMPPEELENIIFGFVHYDYDVLVSTTIIESGIDIPNANTIIINGAQNFGLSDLHQMRGRVGRSNKKAFCYLLAPPLAALTPEARRRLQAIENFSDLGSGIHIAMQDLDIRGAGNLLGAEQSGFIADLGYETYQKILSEAVKELKNDEFGDLYAEEIRKGNDLGGENFVDECALESDLQMSFPDDYVPSSSERMLLYRELDGLERDEDVEAFRLRMKDRFGEIPEEGEELIRVVTLRRLGKCSVQKRYSSRPGAWCFISCRTRRVLISRARLLGSASHTLP